MQSKRYLGILAVLTSGVLMTSGLASAAPAPGPDAASPQPGDCALESTIDDDLNEGPTDYGLNRRPTGDVNVILLFVDFPDATSTDGTNAIADLLSPRIEDYYNEVSYGQLSVHVDAVHQWYRMPSNSGSYNYADFYGQKQLFTDATNAADPDVDFSDYDIILTAEGPGGSHANSPAWLGAYEPVMTDEGPIKWGSTLGQDIHSPSRGYIVPVHEMGHLFGLPDLYGSTGEIHRFVGSWDIMGNIDAKPGMSAWHRNKMGWFAAEQVTCIERSGTTEVFLTPPAEPDGTHLAVVKTSDSEAYAIEYRTTQGRDANLCDEGVLIYKVDANVGGGNGPIELLPAHDPPGGFSCPSDDGGYEALQTPAFDLGPGEVSTFNDPDDELTVEVTAIDGAHATVTIDYQGGPTGYAREVVVTKVTKKGVIKGRVEAGAGVPVACTANVPVKVRLKKTDKVSATTTTAADGTFRVRVNRGKKAKSRYVQAPEKSLGTDVCLEALSSTFKV